MYAWGNPLRFIDPTGMLNFSTNSRCQWEELLRHLFAGGDLHSFNFHMWDVLDSDREFLGFWNVDSETGEGAIVTLSLRHKKCEVKFLYFCCKKGKI